MTDKRLEELKELIETATEQLTADYACYFGKRDAELMIELAQAEQQRRVPIETKPVADGTSRTQMKAKLAERRDRIEKLESLNRQLVAELSALHQPKPKGWEIKQMRCGADSGQPKPVADDDEIKAAIDCLEHGESHVAYSSAFYGFSDAYKESIRIAITALQQMQAKEPCEVCKVWKRNHPDFQHCPNCGRELKAEVTTNE